MNKEIDRTELPYLYQTAFTRDRIALIGHKQVHISVVRAGTLYLPSGRLVACDPLLGKRRSPFVQSVLPGRYPVDFSLGREAGEYPEYIFFSRILFNKKAPVVWVKALRHDQDADVESAEFGLHIKSGTIAFMDLQTADQFRLETLTILDEFLEKLVGNYRPNRSWYLEPIDDDHNALFFTTPVIDHPLFTYFAIDDEGDICLAFTALSR